MAEKEIKITFAGEKLEALSFFLAEQGGKTVEELLKSHLDKSYEKNVPAQVRNLWRAGWKLHRRQQIRSRNPREWEAQDSRGHPADGAGRHRIRKSSRESRCRNRGRDSRKYDEHGNVRRISERI